MSKREPTIERFEFPNCEMCNEVAEYHAKTTNGFFQDLCHHHFLLVGLGLKKGLGMRYIKPMEIQGKGAKDIAKKMLGLKKEYKLVYGMGAFRRWKRKGQITDKVLTLNGQKFSFKFEGRKVHLTKIEK